MESKVLQVFYGTDFLPYKDRELTIHFPIVGNAFQGSVNTNEIRFYIPSFLSDAEEEGPFTEQVYE